MRGARALRLLLNAGTAQRVAAAAASAGCGAAGAAGALSSTATRSSLSVLLAFDRRGLSTSAGAAAAQAAPSLAVQGDLSAVLSEVDALLTGGSAGPKDVADAAMALAALQARGDRRLWGKVFEGAAAVKADFDAASLTAFLWATHTAGVGHFQTTYELVGPASKLLSSFTPAQLATVVEALGAAGVDDTDWLRAVSNRVVSKAGEFSAGQLAKVLAGFAGAGLPDAALARAVLAALGGKAGADASAKDLAQVAWALGKMGRADAAPLGALSKALAGKLTGAEAPSDLVAALWGFAQANHKPDAALLTKAGAAVKAGVAALSPEQQVYAAWSFALLGSADKALFSALFSSLSATISAAPDSLSVEALACLAEAALILAGKGAGAPALPDQVLCYAKSMHGVVADAAKARAGEAGASFRAGVAAATARALGARYKPEVAAAVACLAKTTADGLKVEIGLDDLKVAVLPVDASGLSSSRPRVVLGPVAAQMELLRAAGYAPAVVPAPEFNALPDATAQAKFVLSAIKAAAPGASSQLNALQKKLDAPFDPYAD